MARAIAIIVSTGVISVIVTVTVIPVIVAIPVIAAPGLTVVLIMLVDDLVMHSLVLAIKKTMQLLVFPRIHSVLVGLCMERVEGIMTSVMLVV